ncbi:MAG: hypothetical protein WD046_07790 [Paracoccaceae bacterium]
MVTRVYLGLVGLGFLAFAWFLWAQSAGGLNALALFQSLLTPQNIAVLLFVLLHMPALMTVARQRKAMGPLAGLVGRYPESIVPVLVLLGWLVVGLAFGWIWGAAVAGLVTAISIALCYGLVRALAIAAKRVEAQTGRSAGTEISGFSRAIYQLRVLIGLSAIVVGMHMSGAPNQLTAIVLLAIFATVAATALAYIGKQTLRALPVIAQADMALAVRAAQVQNPASIAIHYSGPAKSQHRELLTLAYRLAGEGLRAAVICREAHAIPALAKSGAQQIWTAPTLGMVDAFDQPELRAIFYVNDGEKNGHVARFNTMAHILVAAGAVLDLPNLPSNFDMYDAIIAPNARVATRWRQSAQQGIAQKIYTVTAGKPALLPACQPMQNPPNIALRIEPDPETGRLDAGHVACCMNILSALRNGAEAKLHLSFPAKPHDGLSLALLQEATIAMKDGVAVSITRNGAATSCNAADIIIARSADSLKLLRQTGKPLFWAGPGLPPTGLVPVVEPGSLIAALADVGAARSLPSLESLRHVPSSEFDSLNALVTHVLAQKARK